MFARTALAALAWIPAHAEVTTEQAGVLLASSDQGHTLIVYLTRTKNTKAVADMIHQEVGGDLVELKLATPYPEDYETIVAQVDRENETGYLPPLKTSVTNLQSYDTVFLGFPTWDMQLPPPMKSFLDTHELEGKTVIPFNTSGGYGTGSSFDDMAELCTGCKIVEGFSTRGGLEQDGIYLAIEGDRKEEVRIEVTNWLQRIQSR